MLCIHHVCVAKAASKLMSSDVDAVVVIGSTLDSHLSRKIVKKLANRQVVVISINADTDDTQLRSVIHSSDLRLDFISDAV